MDPAIGLAPKVKQYQRGNDRRSTGRAPHTRKFIKNLDAFFVHLIAFNF